MSLGQGSPIHFSLRTTDATTAIAVTLYRSGTLTSLTLASDEILEIDGYTIVADTAGDHHLYLGTSTTPAAGETVDRGDFATNGGVRGNLNTTPRVGVAGSILRIDSDVVAVININGTGRIRK